MTDPAPDEGLSAEELVDELEQQLGKALGMVARLQVQNRQLERHLQAEVVARTRGGS